MVARACAYSREDLLALGFYAKEVAKYQRIAGSYRRRKKPEPEPSAWLIRYRKKISEGWTWKTKRPEGVDPKVWLSFTHCASYHRVHRGLVVTFQDYLLYHAGHIGGFAPKSSQPPPELKSFVATQETVASVETVVKRRVVVKNPICKADVSAIVERNRNIVAAKLLEKGLTLPSKKALAFASKR